MYALIQKCIMTRNTTVNFHTLYTYGWIVHGDDDDDDAGQTKIRYEHPLTNPIHWCNPIIYVVWNIVPVWSLNNSRMNSPGRLGDAVWQKITILQIKKKSHKK